MEDVNSGSWTADENCMVIIGYSSGSGYIVISYNGGVELAADNVPFFLKKGML